MKALKRCLVVLLSLSITIEQIIVPLASTDMPAVFREMDESMAGSGEKENGSGDQRETDAISELDEETEEGKEQVLEENDERASEECAEEVTRESSQGAVEESEEGKSVESSEGCTEPLSEESTEQFPDEDEISASGEVGTPSDSEEPPDEEMVATMSNLPRNMGHLVSFYVIENDKWILLEEQYVPDGECADPPTVPEWEGHTFKKWNIDYTRITSDRSISAAYYTGYPMVHAVDFVDYDGRLLRNQEYVTDGGGVERLPDPEREGYTFIEWENWTYEIRMDTRIYPRYEEGMYDTYGVSFKAYIDGRGIQEIQYKRVRPGEMAEPPEKTPEYPGYTFHQWFGDYTLITNDRTISAGYYNGTPKVYAVDYIDYDGRLIKNREYVIEGSWIGRLQDPKREGYTFIEWENLTYQIERDTQIRPRYEKGTFETYAVNFQVYMDGSRWQEIKYEKVRPGEPAVAPEELPECPGYTFRQWNKDYTKIIENRIIQADYYVGTPKVYAVDFVNYDGKLLKNREYITEGSWINRPPDPVREGYTFIKWENMTYQIKEDIQMKAIYENGIFQTYPVTFNAYIDGRSNQEIKYERVKAGAFIQPPTVPERPGYTFHQWDGDYTKVDNTRLIKAVYYEGNPAVHAVDFVDYDGRLLKNREYVVDGNWITRLPDPKREGYTFIKWYNLNYQIKKDTRIWAKYEEGIFDTNPVTFRAYKDGRPFQEIKYERVKLGELAESPEVPECLGYTFHQWDSDYTNVTSYRVINAVYYTGTPVVHAVDFVDYDGKLLKNREYVIDGINAFCPSDPKRPGYTFMGWNTNWLIVRSDSVIRAKYRAGDYKTYKVSYSGLDKSNNGRVPLKLEWVAEGENGVPPMVEEVYGQTFAGWDRSMPYINVNSDRRVFATYYSGKVNVHKVDFLDCDGKLLCNSQYVIDGKSPVEPFVPKREGYTFTGWDRDFYRITEPTAIRAVYRSGELSTGYVYFYGMLSGNQSWVLLKTERVPVGESATPPEVPVYAGFVFQGWDGDYTNIFLSKNIHAKYFSSGEAIRTYTVNFWSGTELLKSQQVQEEGNATAPPAPVGLENYDFSGWSQSFVCVKGNINVYAVYRPREDPDGLISTDEFRIRMSELGLPKPVEKVMVDLGIETRKWTDGSRQNRMAVVIPGIVIAFIAAAVSVIVTAVQEGFLSLDIDIWGNSRGVYYNYIGAAWTQIVFEKLAIEVDEGLGNEGEGDSDAGITSDDIEWNVDDNLKHHVANGTNGNHREQWKKFGLDPDDPNFYSMVLPFLKKVVDEGTKFKEIVNENGTVLFYIKNVAEKGQEIIVKIFVDKEGIVKRLSDAYINTR